MRYRNEFYRSHLVPEVAGSLLTIEHQISVRVRPGLENGFHCPLAAFIASKFDRA